MLITDEILLEKGFKRNDNVLVQMAKLHNEDYREFSYHHFSKSSINYQREDECFISIRYGLSNSLKRDWSIHFAMCEHGTVYLEISFPPSTIIPDERHSLVNFFLNNHYSRVSQVNVFDETGKVIEIVHNYITTNMRVLFEHKLLEKVKKYWSLTPSEHHIKRVTVHMVTDRGVWNECIRHRELQRIDDCLYDIAVDYSMEQEFSFAQESTRFCNYGKEKFNHELSFIIPSWANSQKVYELQPIVEHPWSNIFTNCFNKSREITWVRDMFKTEKNYFDLLKKGSKPEEARTVLNNSLKTEIVMTGFVDETGWLHFFDLRYFGTTGKPQKEIQELTGKIYADFCKLGYIPKNYEDKA